MTIYHQKSLFRHLKKIKQPTTLREEKSARIKECGINFVQTRKKLAFRTNKFRTT